MAELSVTERWAQVAILLNLGRVNDACPTAIAASSHTNWHRRFGQYQNVGRTRIYDTHDLPVGWMWLEPAASRVLISRDTIRRFGLSVSLFRFANTNLRLTSPAFRVYDLDTWRYLDAAARDDWLNGR